MRRKSKSSQLIQLFNRAFGRKVSKNTHNIMDSSTNNYIFNCHFIDGGKEQVRAYNLSDAIILAKARRIEKSEDSELKFVIDANGVVRKNIFECKHDTIMETVTK